MSVFARRLAAVAASLFLTTAAGSAATAQASIVSLSACDGATLTQPFSQWADQNYYKLAPGADFESSLSGWSLSGGAGRVSGSESYGVSGSVGSSSLALPAGSSAQSPYTCVNAAYPDFRFFARTDGAATILVQAVYQLPMLGTVTVPVGVATPSGDWQPTLPMVTGSAIPGALNGGTADVALRFTALSGGAQIDDVYIDPHGRG